MKSFLFLAIALLCALATTAVANPVVRFHTDLGDIDVVLLADVAPVTVANFLGYVERRDYDNSFIHRSVPNFVIQGGGYKFEAGDLHAVPQQPPVVNEFHVSNMRGTLAMAKLGGDPNSATNQWFFNESDNSSNLDNQNGGFTAFGRIVNAAGLGVMDSIAAVPTVNAGSPFDQLPVRNYVTGPIHDENLVHVISVRVVPISLAVSRPSTGLARLEIHGPPLTQYAVQSSTTLLPGSFATLAMLTTDAAGNASYDDNAATGPRKFYRLAPP